MLNWNWVTKHTGFEIPKYIREAVFMREQGYTEEFDDVDNRSLHLIATDDGKPAACLRLFRERDSLFAVGRVAVLPPYRGTGLGALCMAQAEKKAAYLGAQALGLSAQCRVRGFYERSGYTATGDEYPDEGVPHIHMEKALIGDGVNVRWAQPGGDISPALALRRAVFGGEFGYTADPDEHDPHSHTLMLLRDGEVIACGRALPQGESVCKLGKIAVRKDLRGSGLGMRLMETLCFRALELGAQEVTLSAQLVAQGFYECLGFSSLGDVFPIEGKPHIQMYKRL